MTWSLQINDGDLSFGSGGLNTVSGGGKLAQDLRCAVLTPMGTDPMNPSYGSVIDGGRMSDGTWHPGIIGQVNNSYASSFVQSEITRICSAEQALQQQRYQADVATYGSSTLTADEALLGVENISVSQIGDQMLIAATLQTGVGGQPLILPVTTGGSG